MQNLIERIDEWGIKTPDRICYQLAGETYTYGELKTQSDALAYYLQQQFAKEKPIIVYGGLEFEMLVSFLGCVKAGHAYIPINVGTPEERVALILENTDCAGIIGVQKFTLETDKPVVSAEKLAEIISQKQSFSPASYVKGNDNFYIIFTSGSTGVPKGVQINHDNLVSFTDWILSDFEIEAGQTFLSQAPYSFDLSVMDLYPALVSGGSLYGLPKETVDDFKALFALLPNLSLNVWVSTPSFIEICLLEPRFNSEELSQISHFLFCGEELTVETAKKLKERFPQAKIFNTYGPTEATVAVKKVEVTSEILERYERLPIGKSKADTRVVILDETGAELPAGTVGEIVIVGPSVSKGYLNQPEKTAESFFMYEGEPAYHTRDAGMFQDELLFYRGRMDFQVKLHGYRMELEEIDTHLIRSTYVENAVVVPKYQGHKVQQLVAFVVPAANEFEKEFKLTQAIKKELQTMMMDYMIPQKFVYLEQLPLTANGKVDRKGLMNEVNPS